MSCNLNPTNFRLCISNIHIESLKLHDGPKYVISDRMINTYTWQLNLTIKNLQRGDFGEYTCASMNALGKHDARIRLQGKQCFFYYPISYFILELMVCEPLFLLLSF